MKEVYVLSHWDEGVLGVYAKLNDAKFEVRCRRMDDDRQTFIGSNGWWQYYNGGFEIWRMSEDEAEILFRFNETEIENYCPQEMRISEVLEA
ncbi:MAG: hypothetical protein KGI08_09780 [Thaumarchaeota archaeon]|nr:hypothetical protein [Nitrososphaerota archaeon]